MRIILTILAFNFIIIIHELGHFLVARLNGIKVLEFSLFVGPKIFGIKRGDTEYTLRLIPILAYVKMEGEEESSTDQGSFSNKSVWARMAVVAAGPFANLLSSLVILVIIFSIKGYQTTKVVDVESNSIAYNAGMRAGDRIVKYNKSRVYLPTDLQQFFYVYNKEEADLTVIRDKEEKHIKVSSGVVQEERYVLGIVTGRKENSTTIEELLEDYPAKTAGMLPNDKILALNDVDVSNLQEILVYTNANKDQKMKVTLLRNDEKVDVYLVPKCVKDKPIINLGIDFEMYQGNLGEVLLHSTKYIWANIRNVGYTLKWLVLGDVSVSKMTGPVGIVATMSDAASVGQNTKEKVLSLLKITAFINIAIGATNLIPFPALDGNKLLLLMVEAVRKKPISPEKEARISMAGIVVLLGLALVTTYNDIARLVQRIRN
ncbi:MAG: RIP metalloprotease RseP [Clostridiales bacterium]|nr:RIP metalloprotease RseP [Clostridiales bacterium]